MSTEAGLDHLITFTLLTLLLNGAAFADSSIGIFNDSGKKLQVTYKTLDKKGNLHHGPATFKINDFVEHVICLDGEGRSDSCGDQSAAGFTVVVQDVKSVDGNPVIFVETNNCTLTHGNSDLYRIDLLGKEVGTHYEVGCKLQHA